MLERYVAAFARLRTANNRTHWTADTLFRAPHKPFLLLSVLDLISQKALTTNFMQLDADLTESFERYWQMTLGQVTTSTPVYPFFHLRSEGFWHLLPTSGHADALGAVSQISSSRQLQQLVLAARVDDGLWALLQQPHSRDLLRQTLIETYFAPDIRPRVVEAGRITRAVVNYSYELLHRSEHTAMVAEAPAAYGPAQSEVRGAGFRRAIVQAYNHTCAVCGIRLISPDGHTAVAAAHIVPWSKTHNDDPRNGMALCGLHHWTFDKGLLTITASYRVRISPTVESDSATASLRALQAQPMVVPAAVYLWPDKDALRWHRKHVFLTEPPRRLL